MTKTNQETARSIPSKTAQSKNKVPDVRSLQQVWKQTFVYLHNNKCKRTFMMVLLEDVWDGTSVICFLWIL